MQGPMKRDLVAAMVSRMKGKKPKRPRPAKGKTPGGIRVLNVAMPLLAETTPQQRFALVEV